MQQLNVLADWKQLLPKESITMLTGKLFRMDVSTPVGTDWFYQTGESEPQYFATTSGYETLRFVPEKGIQLTASKRCRYRTATGNMVHVENPENDPFTEVANRQERNVEMELVARRAAENALKFDRAMRLENERRVAQRMAELEKQIASGEVDGETGEVIEPDNGTSPIGDSEADRATPEATPPAKQGAESDPANQGG